jgi:hypothetical protein
MTNEPDSLPDGCGCIQEVEMPEWVYRAVLPILLPFGATAIVAPDVITKIFAGQLGILELIRSPSGVQHTIIAVVAFLPLAQLHDAFVNPR